MLNNKKTAGRTKKLSEGAMRTAVETVIRTEICYLKVSQSYNVPLSTQKDYVHRTKAKVC